MNAYPSQKVFATSLMSKGSKVEDVMRKSSAEAKNPGNRDGSKNEYMSYQVQLMSLANLSANQVGDESARLSSQPVNHVKLKQERIIQRLERHQKRDQFVVAPQPVSMPSLIKKSRNPNGVQTMQKGGEQIMQKSTMRQTRAGSSGSRGRKGSWDYHSKSNIDPSLYREPAVTLADLPDPVDQVKLLPLKARLIFKKAMKELDSVDLVNSDQLPMSRPRIRAILKKMKENLEMGTYGDDRNDSKNDRSYSPSQDMLLPGYGKQAERELFGMLIREKKEKKVRGERNEEMR